MKKQSTTCLLNALSARKFGSWDRIRRVCRNINPPSGDILTTICRWHKDEPSDIEEWIVYFALHSICWQVWKERNHRIFRNTQLEPAIITKIACRTMIDWVVAHNKIGKDQGYLWIRNKLQEL
ncbi:unnamed protein product [Linum trigynum]|uniref:Uncharacterized protein n=1 Tax=Linum trigynum TaxID=586398 RepID=A0AAV2DPX8_9ROSI